MKNQKFNGFRSEEEYNEVLRMVKYYLDDYTNTIMVSFDKERCIMEIYFSDNENDFILSLFPEMDYELEICLKEENTNRGYVRLNSSWGCVDGIHRLIEGYFDGYFVEAFEEEEE